VILDHRSEPSGKHVRCWLPVVSAILCPADDTRIFERGRGADRLDRRLDPRDLTEPSDRQRHPWSDLRAVAGLRYTLAS
jgi:hypothetical protein